MGRSASREAKHRERKRSAKYREQQSRLRSLMKRKGLVHCIRCSQLVKKNKTHARDYENKSGNGYIITGRMCVPCIRARRERVDTHSLPKGETL